MENNTESVLEHDKPKDVCQQTKSSFLDEKLYKIRSLLKETGKGPKYLFWTIFVIFVLYLYGNGKSSKFLGAACFTTGVDDKFFVLICVP